jgi:hypothetical protein
MLQLATELHLPLSYWNQLSQDDQTEFIKLRAHLHRGQQPMSKDVRMASLRRELLLVLSYLERSPDNMEARAILSGICFVASAVCVNTRQLKSLLGRCKSSINGCFKQLGFVAVRTKAKARGFIAAALTSIKDRPEMIRQWTVRCTSSASQFCFLSSFPRDNLPTINASDLEPSAVKPPPMGKFFVTKGIAPLTTRRIDFELEELFTDVPEFDLTCKVSFSLGDLENGLDDFDDRDLSEHAMKRSESAKLDLDGISFLDIQ